MNRAVALALFSFSILLPGAPGVPQERVTEKEWTEEILNFPDAPFELVPSPTDESGPNWGGLLSIACTVHNTSDHPLRNVAIRVHKVWGVNPIEYEVYRFELLLGRGERVQILLTSPHILAPGDTRFVVMPEAAEGFAGERWTKTGLEKIMRDIARGAVHTQVSGRSPKATTARPVGRSACARLRRQIEAACPWGYYMFRCVAPAHGEPFVTSQCADAPGLVEETCDEDLEEVFCAGTSCFQPHGRAWAGQGGVGAARDTGSTTNAEDRPKGGNGWR
jgi:hypothetical protein